MSRTRAQLRLHLRTFEEDGQWVGRCDELGISTCADSAADAEAGILDATTLYLETLEDEGELERVLAELELKLDPVAGSSKAREWEEQVPVFTGSR